MANSNNFGSAVISDSTSNTIYFMLRKTADNTEQTGKVYSDITAQYIRAGASATAVTEATQTTNGAWSSGGIVEMDATNSPGLYRFDAPDAAFAYGVNRVIFTFKCASCYLSVVEVPICLEPGLSRTGTASGVAAQSITLESGAPHTTDEWKGALIYIENATTGAGQAGICTTSSNANPPVLTMDRAWGISLTGTVTYRAYKGSLPLSAAEITAQITTDVPSVNTTKWNGTAVATPATAGIPDVNVKNIDNDAASASGTVTFPNATLASTTNITGGTITTVTNLTNAPTSGDLTSTMKTSVGTAVAASAVASVTGNVGGNVTGSVGSVVGAVGSVTGDVGGNVVGNVTGNVGGNVTGSVGSVTTVSDKTGYTLSNTGMDNLLTRAITEAYSTDGGTISIGTALYDLLATLQEFSISGTTATVKKRNGSTTAFTLALNDATDPSAITRNS